MRTLLSILLTVLILISFHACDNAEEAGDINVEAEIFKEMEAAGIPSVVAGVVKGDQLVWEGTFGYADIASAAQADRLSLYSLQSITKLFLSVTVMQLWERGQIDLEADINRYLPFEVRNPNFPDRKITPYMLLTHTSGLAHPVLEDRIPDFDHFYPLGEEPLISEWLPEYILPGGAHYREAVWKEFPPGEQQLYSNIGTSLLGLMVEHISGMDFRDFCRENILLPLEMHHTAFRLTYMDESLLVTPYGDRGNPMLPFTCRHYPAGFLNTNVEDFSHFVIAMLNSGEYHGRKVLERSTFAEMIKVRNPASGMAFLWNNCMGDCIAKKGGGTGFSTWVEWHFDSDMALFLFSNRRNDLVYPGDRICELVRYQARKE